MSDEPISEPPDPSSGKRSRSLERRLPLIMSAVLVVTLATAIGII